ncbi:hypothetical protein LMG18095_00005 [Ralstonia thomasii]|jgi:hypothetical protein|uniref:Uncharacterized protein n=1 Tax=Ralstonia thomasii TaxID=3058596 RepID=A0ABM9IX77_9RALS|nr:hypothetical protein LMG18095_00005 [Ralstonia sp. LMG 18095]
MTYEEIEKGPFAPDVEVAVDLLCMAAGPSGLSVQNGNGGRTKE